MLSMKCIQQLLLLLSAAAVSGLHVEQRNSRFVLVDDQGRQRLLRGINLATLGEHGGAGSQVPIDTSLYQNGSCPANNNNWYQPPICEHDIRELKAVGFDSFRLLVHWSQIEPQPGQYDRAYFARINQVIDWAESSGVDVLIDFHQDNYANISTFCCADDGECKQLVRTTESTL